MANINQFVLGPHLYDLDGLTYNLLEKLVNDHVGEDNGITHRGICHYYYDPHPIQLEDEFLISNILQRARMIVQDVGMLLDWRRNRGWFVVQTTEEALRHLLRYTKRQVRLHGRLVEKAYIATGARYQLPADNQLILAIQGMTPHIEQLEEAVHNAEVPPPPPEEE